MTTQNGVPESETPKKPADKSTNKLADLKALIQNAELYKTPVVEEKKDDKEVKDDDDDFFKQGVSFDSPADHGGNLAPVLPSDEKFDAFKSTSNEGTCLYDNTSKHLSPTLIKFGSKYFIIYILTLSGSVIFKNMIIQSFVLCP